MSKNRENDYPKQRSDYLMTVEYADKKSRFHCILCEKTHFIKDCPNKLTKIEPIVKKYKDGLEYQNDDIDNPNNYGW